MIAALWHSGADEVLQRSRFVLGVLTLCSLLVCTPYMLVVSGDDRPAIATCVPILVLSIVQGFRTRRVRLVTELVEATCLCLIMAAMPTPLTAFIFMFPLLWCRALYGGSGQMLLRSVLHISGTLLSVPLSRILFQPVEPNLSTFLNVGLSSIFFIGIAGRQLAVGMRASDEGARRERLISASGTKLLGVTDAGTIRRITWETILELVAGTPGLRVLVLERDGEQLQVVSTAGVFAAVPPSFALADLGFDTSQEMGGSALPREVAVLDQVVGQHCQWVAESYPPGSGRIFLLIGHSGQVGAEISPAVKSVANQAALALQNSEVHQELTVQALTDSLTGLANRQGFAEATQRMIAASRDTATAVLFVDLDDFKEVNDTLGHQTGDELLQQVADLLTSVTRADDIVARLGGDEFAILLRNTEQPIAEQVAERVVLGVSVLSVTLGPGLNVGASVGVAMADRSTRFEDLLVHADLAMYAAKADGKGRIQTYHPDLLPTTRIPR